jgi:hypothetical protein
VALQVAVGCRRPLRRTVLVQLVAAVANRVTPGNVGGAAVNTRFLTRLGFTGGQAGAAVGACGLAQVMVAVLGVVVFGPAVAVTVSARIVNASSDGDLWIAVACFLAAAAAVILRVRHRHRSSAWAAGRAARLMTEAKAAARDLLHQPVRLAALIVTVTTVKAANLLALYSALWAFDGDVASWRIRRRIPGRRNDRRNRADTIGSWHRRWGAARRTGRRRRERRSGAGRCHRPPAVVVLGADRARRAQLHRAASSTRAVAFVARAVGDRPHSGRGPVTAIRRLADVASLVPRVDVFVDSCYFRAGAAAADPTRHRSGRSTYL